MHRHRHKHRHKALFFLLFVLTGWNLGGLRAEETSSKLKLGIARVSDAVKRDVEFQQYEWMLPAFKKENIEASLMPQEPFYIPGTTREQLDHLLQGYHVVHLTTTEEGVSKMTPEIEAHARMVGEALADYVRQGGGLFLELNSVRYPGMQDEKYWNIVLAPLGISAPHEGIYDPTRTFEGVILYGRQPETFWFTQNFSDRDSPLLEGVRGLCLPLKSSDGTPGVASLKYSDDWKVVVRGEKEAQSFVTPESNNVETKVVGMYKEAPPVVAVRALGKGRVVSYPLARIFTGMNHLNPVWPDIVESRGNPQEGQPSDSMRLQLNAYHWLGEPAKGVAELGTHRVVPSAPIRYDRSVSWDNKAFSKREKEDEEYRGVIGARSNFSGGGGTVEEYVKAAKEAGLKFIVFSDPLEKLTLERLEALKKACAEASKDGDFYACPGVQFTDAAGIRWAIWGESIIFPPKDFTPKSAQRTYEMWDGKRILARGHYMDLSGMPGGAVLSYKELRENKAHPENLWWFWHYFPRVYENGKLVEDQYGDYLFGLRDLRKVGIASYTGIDRPEEVGGAAKQFYTSFPSMDAVHKALNTWAQRNVYAAPWWNAFYISEGPRIVDWDAINAQMEENWNFTRGAQRVRLKFNVQSDKGIRDVKIHDADQGVIRRFDGHGAKELIRAFEMVNDRSRYLTLEVTDVDGKKAFSQFWNIYSYKQGLFRCGDNLNILGALGMQWHPDRNQFFDAAKNFQNGVDFEIKGVDTSIPLTPMPQAWLMDTVNIKGVGVYPSVENSPGMTSKLMDVALSSYNMQVATMELDRLAQRFDTETRPGPSWGSSPQDVAENAYFRRTHRLISPMDRIDWYTAWNYRRGREGRKDYQGSFNWHEGEITFKKDVVLQGAVPIPLVRFTCPYDPEKGWGTHFVVSSGGSDREEEDRVLEEGKKESVSGTLKAGGFVSQLPSLVGYQAFLAGPDDQEYAYYGSFSGDASQQGVVLVGLGHDGQEIKAGTVLKYSFAVGVFTDKEPNASLLHHTVKAMHLAGGKDGYPLTVETGKIENTGFFLTLDAKDQETKFIAGPQKLLIDLPIIINGIEDNGCAAVFSTKRPWFRFISVVNDRAWFQEPIDDENAIWAGNIFVADNKDLKITAVIDGQNKGRKPFLEVHNPTEKEVTTKLRSPQHTPEFGGFEKEVTIPAGESIRVDL